MLTLSFLSWPLQFPLFQAPTSYNHSLLLLSHIRLNLAFALHSSNHCRIHLIPLFRHFLKMFSKLIHSYSHSRRRLPFRPTYHLYIFPILLELHPISHSSILSHHHSLSTLLRNYLIFRLARPNCSFTTTHSLSNLANSPPPLRTLNLLIAFIHSFMLFLSLISLSISALI